MRRSTHLGCRLTATPVGMLKLVSNSNRLIAVLWENDVPGRVRLGPMEEDPSDQVLSESEAQLWEYFAGKRRRFTLPLQFVGTEFQKKVWSALSDIPFGETRTYGEIAAQIGHPTASRAVGAANSRNPISIIAPCHRVIGKDGSLTGYAGGLQNKAFLLALEDSQKTEQ